MKDLPLFPGPCEFPFVNDDDSGQSCSITLSDATGMQPVYFIAVAISFSLISIPFCVRLLLVYFRKHEFIHSPTISYTSLVQINALSILACLSHILEGIDPFGADGKLPVFVAILFNRTLSFAYCWMALVATNFFVATANLMTSKGGFTRSETIAVISLYLFAQYGTLFLSYVPGTFLYLDVLRRFIVFHVNIYIWVKANSRIRMMLDLISKALKLRKTQGSLPFSSAHQQQQQQQSNQGDNKGEQPDFIRKIKLKWAIISIAFFNTNVYTLYGLVEDVIAIKAQNFNGDLKLQTPSDVYSINFLLFIALSVIILFAANIFFSVRVVKIAFTNPLYIFGRHRPLEKEQLAALVASNPPINARRNNFDDDDDDLKQQDSTHLVATVPQPAPQIPFNRNEEVEGGKFQEPQSNNEETLYLNDVVRKPRDLEMKSSVSKISI